MDKPIVFSNEYITLEINNFRMSDVIEYIEIFDLNNNYKHIFKCEIDDYYLDQKIISLKKKTITYKDLKQKKGLFYFKIKIISKTGKELYNKEFTSSSERLEKIIKITFI